MKKLDLYLVSLPFKKGQANLNQNTITKLIFILIIFLNAGHAFSQCVQQPLINFPFNGSATPTIVAGAGLSASTSAALNAANGVATTGTAFFTNATAGGCLQTNIGILGSANNDFSITGTNLSQYKTFAIYFQTQRTTGTLTANYDLTFQYSKNGGAFQNFTGSTATVTTTYTAVTATLPVGADNPATSLVIRLVAQNNGLGSNWRVDNFQVKALPAPVAPVTTNSLICLGGTATLSATVTGSANINWYAVPTGGASLSASTSFNPVNGNPTIPIPYDNNTSGVYTFYAESNLLGCASTRTPATVTVGIPVSVNPTSVPNPICAGLNAAINANITNGAPPYTISWTPSTFLSSTTSATPTAVGITATTTYTVNVTDVCGNTTSGSVTINVNPLPAVAITSVPAPPVICATGSVSLTACCANSYSWAPSTALNATTGATVISSTTTTRTYTVTGTDINGCSATSSITVIFSPAINPVAGSNTPFCPGGNINLTSGPNGMSYQWSGPNGYSSTAQNPVISGAGASDAGTYTVVVTNANNCSATASTTVNMALPVTATASLVSTVPNPLCASGNANLSATPSNGKSPFTYAWAPATFLNSTTSQTPVATSINTTTTYTVTITDACGVTATDDVTVTVHPNPTVSVLSTPSQVICTAGSVTLNASGNSVSYAWTPATGLGTTTGSSVTATPPVTTVYTVTGTGANGCTATQTITINVSPATTLTATATANPICSGTNTTLNSAATNTGSYSVTAIPINTLSGTQTNVSLGNDAMSGAIALPFNFSFYGRNFTQLFISSNGFLQLGTSSGTNGTYGQNLPSASNPNNIIAGAWSNLNPSGGTIGYFISGTAPNRIFTVNYTNVQIVGLLLGNGSASFQVQLYETTNVIEVHLLSIAQPLLPTGGPTTVALKNFTGSLATGAPARFNNGNWNAASEAWRFTPSASGGYTFTWSPSTFLTSTNVSNPVAVNVTSSTVYTVTSSDANGCSTTKTIDIDLSSPQVVLTGSPVGCFGQPVTLNAVTSGGFTNTVSALNNTAAAISSSGTPTVTSNITMGAGVLEAASQLTVTLNLTHSFSGDLRATLTGPCGTTVLFDRLGVPASSSGNSNDLNGQYVFRISAPGVLSETGALPAGTYRPSDVNGLAHNFTGLTFPCSNTAGTWTLTIQDLASGDGGTLNSWSIGNTQENYTSTFSGPPVIGTVTTSGLHNSIADVPVTPGTAGNNTYTVTVTDITGCSATQSITINASSLPAPYVFPDDTVLCSGNIINIVARDNNAYASGWPAGTMFDFGFGPTTDSNFVVNGPGIYNTTVYLPGGLGGCTATSPNANIDYRDSPVLNVNSTEAGCFGTSTGSVYAEILIGTGPFRYKYYNSLGNIVKDITTYQDKDTLFNLPAGQYSIVVYDTVTAVLPTPSCHSDSLIITVGQPALLVASETHTVIPCNGNSSSVTITATGGTPPYTGTGVFSQQAGTTAYTVTDSKGCVSTVNLTLTQPNVLTTATTTTYIPCVYNTANVTGTATGGTMPYAYAWSNGASTAVIAGVPTDTYVLTVTDNQGCVASVTEVVSAPGPVTITSAVTNLLCRGVSTGALTPAITGGSGPYTYLWNNGSTLANRSGLPAGTYTVTVSDVNGCSKTKSHTVSQPATLMVINSSKTNVRCYGLSSGSATASPSGGTAPYTFLWTTFPAKTTATATGLTAGVYTCNVTDAIGCVKVLTVNITEPPDLSVFQTQTNVTFPGGNDGTASVSITGGTPGYTYSWNTSPVKTTTTVTGLTAGLYKCTITDTKSCTVKASFIITEPISRPGTSQPDQTSEWKVTASPNPTSGNVIISFDSDRSEPVELKISDYTGRIVYQVQSITVTGKNEFYYDFSGFAKGVYFIRLNTSVHSKVIRMVIE